MSGQDWKNIELTLVSGRPVAFHQALYEAYYVTRPEVPVEVAGRLDAECRPRRRGVADRRARARRSAPAPNDPRNRCSNADAEGGGCAGRPMSQAGNVEQIEATDAATQVSSSSPAR